MKKLGCLILLVIVLLSLTACGGEICALPNKLDALYLYRNPIETFSQEQSGQMANVMGGNRVYITEDALYTLELDENSAPVLASYKLEAQRLSDYEVLRVNCAPRWIREHEGILYYINGENGDALECIELEGLEHQVLVDGPCSYLQVEGGKLYFRNAEHIFCSAELNGQNITGVLDEPCCYPYIFGDRLIYQSESEGEILKLRFLNGAKVIDLTQMAAYAPVIINDRIFYTCDGWVQSMRLDGMSPARCSSDYVSAAAEYIFEGGAWYARAVSTGYGVQQWRCALPEGMAEDYPYSGYSYCDFLGFGFRVDADYFADGRLRAFMVYTPQGGGAEYLYGKITNLG